ncbi:MAG: hypothetical protein HRF50_17720 [Phycisphaerae bacterium]
MKKGMRLSEGRAPRPMRPLRRVLAAAAVVAVGAQAPVSAQLAVHDASVTARNTTTAIVKEILLRLQQEQHGRLRRMAQRLSLFTDLRKYVLADPPRWRTHGDERFIYSAPYNDALIFGDSAGAAYTELAHPLVADAARLAALPATARRLLSARLATVQLTDAAIIAGTHDTGQLRFSGRKQELPAIDALESHVVDPSNEQSATAVLDKISGAVLIGARQRQARVQLLAALVEQLLVDSKRARDTDAAAIAMQVASWRDGKAANRAFAAGTADALRTWRQP